MISTPVVIALCIAALLLCGAIMLLLSFAPNGKASVPDEITEKVITRSLTGPVPVDPDARRDGPNRETTA